MCCHRYGWNIFDSDVKQIGTSHFNSTLHFAIHVIHIQIVNYLNIIILYFCLCGNYFNSFSTTRDCTGHCLVYLKLLSIPPQLVQTIFLPLNLFDCYNVSSVFYLQNRCWNIFFSPVRALPKFQLLKVITFISLSVVTQSDEYTLLRRCTQKF